MVKLFKEEWDGGMGYVPSSQKQLEYTLIIQAMIRHLERYLKMFYGQANHYVYHNITAEKFFHAKH